MTSRFDQTDLTRIRTNDITGRHSKVSVDDIIDPASIGDTPVGDDLRAALPDILAAESLKRVCDELIRARDAGKEIVWMIGAHTIKVGLSKYIGALIDEGFITTVASTGSATIHDLELAFFGKTSEDVGAELPKGRFGMSDETAERYAAACRHAATNGLGLGEGFGVYVSNEKAPHADASVYARAHAKGIPATVHVALGTDIVHMHPGFPAAEVGDCSMRDFRIFTERVGRVFDAGVAVIFGSAVVLPEVFLKAVSVNYNLGAKPSGVTAVSFDMIRHYRVSENVLARPFQEQGTAHSITGHHEIMLPLLYFLLSRRS